jgi:hypothetical protein
MERWSVAKCRSKDGTRYYLANRARTIITITKRTKSFDIMKLMEKLQKVNFPLRFTKGIESINFSILDSNTYGEYGDDEVWVDVRKKRRLRTIVETFVHEVAHHVDYMRTTTLSGALHNERKRRGQYIHKIAAEDDEEYFARGFERFYSLDPRKKQALREHNPKLYRVIQRLHREYSHK